LADELTRRIRRVLSQVLDLDSDSIPDELHRENVDGWDSLNHLRLVTALEEELGVRFTMREVGEMSNLARIREIVEARQ